MPVYTLSSASEISSFLASQYNFDVLRLPLHGPDNMPTPHCGLFRSDLSGSDACIGNAVSPKYVPHQTRHVAGVVEAARQIFDGELSIDCYWNEGHFLVIQPTRRSVLEIAKGDKVIPRLTIHAGYDGKGFKASAGFFRFVCTNLARLQSVAGTSRTIRHTLSFEDKFDNLLRDFSVLDASWQTTVEKINRMNANRIKVADFMFSLFGDVQSKDGRAKTVAINTIEKILGRLVRESEKLGIVIDASGAGDASGWMLWNAVQGYLQHDSTRKESDATLKGYQTFDDALLAQAESLALGV